jgi:hypothetical protein
MEPEGTDSCCGTLDNRPDQDQDQSKNQDGQGEQRPAT